MQNDEHLNRLKSFAENKQLSCHHGTVLLTVSGGVDSVTMVHLFHEAGWKFAIAHCNFGLRNEESDRDEKFVAALAKKYKVDFYKKHFNTAQYAHAHKVSIQMAARELRYAWFRELLYTHQFSAIATAHHQTDVVETILINLIRGAGIAGFHGILPKKENIIRPLLCFTKEEIMQYARLNDLQYREDSSNESDDYLRNKIRHHILPVMKEMNAQLESAVSKTAQRIRDWEALALAQVKQLKERYILYKEDTLYINFEGLKKELITPAILHHLLSEFGFNEDQAKEILLTKETNTGRIFYTSTHKAIINREELIVAANKDKLEEMPIVFSLDKEMVEVNEKRLFIKKQVKPETFIPDTSINKAYCDAEKLVDPLQLRKWKKGDVFYPLGLGKRKKLSDFLTDNRFSVIDKENMWLLVCGDNIVWIPLHRMDDRYKITDKTTEMIIFEWI